MILIAFSYFSKTVKVIMPIFKKIFDFIIIIVGCFQLKEQIYIRKGIYWPV